MPTESHSRIAELPEGFVYAANFLSSDEENELIAAFDRLTFQPFEFHGYTAKREIIEYGFHYDFEGRSTSEAAPVPAYLLPARAKAGAFAEVPAEDLVEAIITRYPPGAPIGWHRDVPQFEIVIGISLASSCRMRLKPLRENGNITSVILEPGSIYVMRGPARWNYQHSIPAVEQLRYSVTFRSLRAKRQSKAG